MQFRLILNERLCFFIILLAQATCRKPPRRKQDGDEPDLSKPWQPNYCNDTKLQQEADLQKTALGQFLGYPCDTMFFQCRYGALGWRTYKKNCRKGLYFDTTGTQNCNYDFNVQGCGLSQCADCLSGQFACCLSEECVEMSQRCDGRYDCLLEEDEQNCPTCKHAQFACVNSDECIPIQKRCNGYKECRDGTDETMCDECPVGMFYCLASEECIEGELRCDGKPDCSKGEDENLCDIDRIGKPYICENQEEEIALTEVCNGVEDCLDGSDEFYCPGKIGSNGAYNANTRRNNEYFYEYYAEGAEDPNIEKPKA